MNIFTACASINSARRIFRTREIERVVPNEGIWGCPKAVSRAAFAALYVFICQYTYSVKRAEIRVNGSCETLPSI